MIYQHLPTPDYVILKQQGKLDTTKQQDTNNMAPFQFVPSLFQVKLINEEQFYLG